MLFSNKKFSGSSAVTCFCVCVWVRGRGDGQLQHLFTSKKQTTVFSLVLHGCLHQRVKLRKPKWVYKKKNIYRGIRTSFYLCCGCCWWVLSARERGASHVCAVTWLDCDRHLKRWHSAGQIVTLNQEEEARSVQGLWSMEPPLSANTRWSTEPPWIL